MRHVTLVAAALLLSGCHTTGSPADSAVIYKLALDTVFTALRDSASSIVAASRTVTPSYVRFIADSGAVPRDIGPALAKANDHDSAITRFDSLPVRQYFLDSATADHTVPFHCMSQVACDSAWARFRSTYPGAIGWVRVSRIGFKGNQAAVMVGGVHGLLNGEWVFVRVKHSVGGWRVVQLVTLAVS